MQQLEVYHQLELLTLSVSLKKTYYFKELFLLKSETKTKEFA